MAETRDEKRKLHALRKHIDEMLAAGAVIEKREPLTLSHSGQKIHVKHGILVSYVELPELVASQQCSDSLRQIAVNICLQQLNDALTATAAHTEQPACLQTADGSVMEKSTDRSS